MTVETLRSALPIDRLRPANRPSDRAIVWAVAVALAALVGVAVAIAPLIAILGVAALAFGLALLSAGARTQRGFLTLLGVILIGYMFFSRGFAYIGVRPIFIGEVVLATGVFAFLCALPRVRMGLPSALIVLFMVWGALRTIPYIPTYGVDALRDGVTWEYGAFALFVGAFAMRRDVETVVKVYGRLVPLFLLWVPIATALNFAGVVPTIPGTDVPIIGFKQGDMGVQLAGVAGFMLAGLYAWVPGRRLVPEWLLWVAWFPEAAIVAAQTRGAMLAMSFVGVALLLVRPSARWIRAFAIAAVILVVAIALNPGIDVGYRRSLSVTQVLSNITSVFGDTGNEDLDGSREWRLAWWDTIINYTVHGPYFWTGKGFGINLANADGFQVGINEGDATLRAPHNGHIEILARSGVPGLVLWILMNVAWLVMMVRASVRFRRARDSLASGVIAWLVVLWGAALINASFDVYLQGPHGGIWFWAVVGLGIALSRKAPATADEGAEGVGRPAITPPVARPAFTVDR